MLPIIKLAVTSNPCVRIKDQAVERHRWTKSVRVRCHSREEKGRDEAMSVHAVAAVPQAVTLPCLTDTHDFAGETDRKLADEALVQVVARQPLGCAHPRRIRVVNASP